MIRKSGNRFSEKIMLKQIDLTPLPDVDKVAGDRGGCDQQAASEHVHFNLPFCLSMIFSENR
jgi:hypothetical protein